MVVVERSIHFGAVEEVTQNIERVPLLIDDFPDPTYCEGRIFATQSIERGINCQVATVLSDGEVVLERWDALPVLPKWVDSNHADKCWAPDVKRINGSYGMYFSAKAKNGGMGIGFAISLSLDRPFDPMPEPLHYSPDPRDWSNIDPYVATKAGPDGAIVADRLYWGSMSKPIKAQQLDKYGSSFMPGSQPEEILAPDPTRPRRKLFEAPLPLEVGGHKFLLLSGNGWRDDYFVSVARFDESQGRYVMRSDSGEGYQDSVILRGDDVWLNPGHPDVFVENGRLCMLVAALRAGGDPHKRSLLGCELTVRNGWIEVVGGKTPSLSMRRDLFRV